ncbi:DNA repair exonuclease [Thioclava sp. BHET1]|nr:DNA repair exonuclease [Thioclava sp. BHET1]
MAFKFLHTADLHLDSPLKALALREPELAEKVGTATRTALTRIVDLCIEEEVDALLIAGDLWDGKYSSTKTPRFLKIELNRLDSAGICCFIIRGNHDAESKLNAELEAPPSTVIFTGRDHSRSFHVGDMEIAVHGVSMPSAHVAESLLPRYPAPVVGAINIGMMHTSLNGSAAHDPYAPCALSDLDSFGYDYWALGHIHKRAEYHGLSTVVMPGTPQGRDIGELGETSVSLVTIQPDKTVDVSTRPVASVRFERISVPVDGLDDWAEIISALKRELEALAARAVKVDARVVRPVMTGSSPLAWRIRRDRDSLTDEAIVVAETLGGIWIDKLELSLEVAENTEASQLPTDLVALVRDGLEGDPALDKAAREALDELLSDMPADLRDFLGDSADEIEQSYMTLLKEGSADLLTRLSAVAEGE